MTTVSPFAHMTFVLGETTEADLRTLQVGHDGHGAPDGGRGLAYLVVARLVVGVLAVAEVEPSHVHAGDDEFTERLRTVDCGTQGADNLCTTIHEASLDSRTVHPFDRPRSSPRTVEEHRAACVNPPVGVAAQGITRVTPDLSLRFARRLTSFPSDR
jgi:hypothetical protein